MEETTRAHKARLAIRTFKIVADALFLRGNYTLGGKSGRALEDALRTLSPEIYGTMNDPKSIELKGLEYIAKDVKVRCAYYASDNPLKSGQTLASGALGMEGIRPTYMITKAILEKIFNC